MTLGPGWSPVVYNWCFFSTTRAIRWVHLRSDQVHDAPRIPQEWSWACTFSSSRYGLGWFDSKYSQWSEKNCVGRTGYVFLWSKIKSVGCGGWSHCFYIDQWWFLYKHSPTIQIRFMLQINKTTTKQKMYVESCVGEKIMKQNNNNEQNNNKLVFEILVLYAW